jgi:hypothetical protein
MTSITTSWHNHPHRNSWIPIGPSPNDTAVNATERMMNLDVPPLPPPPPLNSTTTQGRLSVCTTNSTTNTPQLHDIIRTMEETGWYTEWLPPNDHVKLSFLLQVGEDR